MKDLFTNGIEHETVFSTKIVNLIPNLNQPRKLITQEAIEELKKSISAVGLINPLTVTKQGEFFQIVAGHRRWMAVKELGFEQVQVRYVDKNLLEISLLENLQREDLLPMEKAASLEILKKEHNYTNEQLANIIGKSATTVSEILKLNQLPEEIKSECYKSNKYVHTRLLEVVKAPDFKTMRRLFEAYKNELEGACRNTGKGRKIEKLDGFLSRVAGMITQIDKISIESMTVEDCNSLFKKLDDLQHAVQNKLNDYGLLGASVSRGYEELSDDVHVLTDCEPATSVDSVDENSAEFAEYFAPSQQPMPDLPETPAIPEVTEVIIP